MVRNSENSAKLHTANTSEEIPLWFSVSMPFMVVITSIKPRFFHSKSDGQPLSTAALVRRAGEITAYETHCCVVALDVFRLCSITGIDVRWLRLWETLAKILFASALGVEITKGYQGNDPQNIGKFNVMAVQNTSWAIRLSRVGAGSHTRHHFR